jgi:hypothetical protein
MAIRIAVQFNAAVRDLCGNAALIGQYASVAQAVKEPS